MTDGLSSKGALCRSKSSFGVNQIAIRLGILVGDNTEFKILVSQ